MAAAKSKPASAKNRTDQDAWADRFLRKFDKQGPVITGDDVNKIEAHFRADSGNSQYRRMALIFLTKSGKDLVELAEGDLETGKMLADAAAGISRAAERHRKTAELLETAATRIEVAMCVREDVTALLKTAKAEHANYSPKEAANG